MNYYRLETEEYTFYLRISKGDMSDTISIGGVKGECVNISVNKPDSLAVQRGYHKLEIGTIPILEWNAKCAVDSNLAKGSGTIAMIRIVLSEVKIRYPYVELYQFRDNSHIQCDNGKGIPLLHISLMEYKQSWYERHFNAFIDEPSYNKKYKDGIKMLDSPEFKLPFGKFIENIQQHISISILNSIKSYYEKTFTYFEFFKLIVDTQGEKNFCILIVDWIDIFIHTIFSFDPLYIPWAIHRDSIQLIHCNETPLVKKPVNQFGGKRKNMTYRRGMHMRVNIKDTY